MNGYSAKFDTYVAMTQTLRMRIRPLLVKYIFHENIFTDLFCFVLFMFSLVNPPRPQAAGTPSKTCSLPSPPSRPSACLAPVRTPPRGCHSKWLEAPVMLRATPQLRATPPVFWNCRFEAASPALLGILPNAQMRMYLDTYMRAALTRGARHAYWHLRLWCRVWYVLAPCKSACAVSGVDPCVTQAFVSAAFQG
jgi:hypothetical protein